MGQKRSMRSYFFNDGGACACSEGRVLVDKEQPNVRDKQNN